MKYFKKFDNFSPRMLIFANKQLKNKVPKKLDFSYKDTKLEYELGEIVPSDSMIRAIYNKKKDSKEDDLFSENFASQLILALYAKSEPQDMTNPLETRQEIIFIEISAYNYYMGLKINHDNRVNHYLKFYLNFSDKTKKDLVALINSFNMNVDKSIFNEDNVVYDTDNPLGDAYDNM